MMIDYLRIPVFTGNYFRWSSTGKWVGALEVEGFWIRMWLLLLIFGGNFDFLREICRKTGIL